MRLEHSFNSTGTMQNIENDGRGGENGNAGPGNDTDIKADNQDNADEKAAGSGEKEAAKYAELNDKYLRLYSDFDNYRKRSIRERSELLKTASEDAFKAILPVIDDFERAIRANENVSDVTALKEGMLHIYKKLKNNVQQKGLQSFDSIGETFDPDTMEAITHVETADESQKGKVVDEVEKGYKLGDKVIRFAKVVVAR
jgi:molecular chaperone GrpE